MNPESWSPVIVSRSRYISSWLSDYSVWHHNKPTIIQGRNPLGWIFPDGWTASTKVRVYCKSVDVGSIDVHRTVHGVPKQSIWSSSRIRELRFWPSELNYQLWKTSSSVGSMFGYCPLVESVNCTFEVNGLDFVNKTLEASEDKAKIWVSLTNYRHRIQLWHSRQTFISLCQCSRTDLHKIDTQQIKVTNSIAIYIRRIIFLRGTMASSPICEGSKREL